MNPGREVLRVLVADDEGALCQGVRRVLEPFVADLPDQGERAAFEVKIVGSAEDCLRELAAQAPDVILLDYKLPGMTGLEVLEKASSQTQGALWVMISAYASLEIAVQATKLGAYDFLAKPFSPDELRCVMRKAANHLILRRRAQRLEAERRRIRFEFISVLAHELKAPLNAVEGYMDILLERTGGEELQMVERSLTRLGGMKKLILDLLDLTRIESGLKKRELREIDLEPLLRGALEAVAADARARRVVLDLTCVGPVRMRADAGEVEIIFNNLLSNAVKYNREGGKAAVRLSREGDLVTFAVSDTGIGLSAEELDKLFRDFVRIRNAETANILGSGLGLSTVKKLAKLYGGDAAVRSRPGAGSTFTVTLRDTGAAPGEAEEGQAACRSLTGGMA